MARRKRTDGATRVTGGSGFDGNASDNGDATTAVVDRSPAIPPPAARPPLQAHDEPPSHKQDPILSPVEVASLLGKHPDTIRRWIRDGLLPTVRMPSGVEHVRRSVVNTFLRGTALPQKEI